MWAGTVGCLRTCAACILSAGGWGNSRMCIRTYVYLCILYTLVLVGARIVRCATERKRIACRPPACGYKTCWRKLASTSQTFQNKPASKHYTIEYNSVWRGQGGLRDLCVFSWLRRDANAAWRKPGPKCLVHGAREAVQEPSPSCNFSGTVRKRRSSDAESNINIVQASTRCYIICTKVFKRNAHDAKNTKKPPGWAHSFTASDRFPRSGCRRQQVLSDFVCSSLFSLLSQDPVYYSVCADAKHTWCAWVCVHILAKHLVYEYDPRRKVDTTRRVN